PKTSLSRVPFARPLPASRQSGMPSLSLSTARLQLPPTHELLNAATCWRTQFIARTSSCASATPQGAVSAPARELLHESAGLENFATVGRSYAMIVPKPVPASGKPCWPHAAEAPLPHT